MVGKMSFMSRSSSLSYLLFFSAVLFSSFAFAGNRTLQLSISPRADSPAVLAPHLTYDVTVPATELHKLNTNFVVRSLNTLSTGSALQAQDLLSPFARAWLNRPAPMDGPNCFHASIAGASQNWNDPRFMDEFEHGKHMSDHAQPIAWNGRTGLEFGDILVFSTADYGPVHVAIYIGTADGEAIVFQKASMNRETPYTFMKMRAAIALYNDTADGPDLEPGIAVYRLKSNVIDPLTLGNPGGIVLDFPGL